MFNWLKKYIKPVILEVEKEMRLPELTADVKASLASLEHHPGFQYLTIKMRHERAMLEKYLHEGFSLTEGQMHHLQGGIHYLKYMESEVARATRSAEQKLRDATKSEQELFEKFYAESIEKIG